MSLEAQTGGETKMKTSMIVALAGVVGLLALAGVVAASSPMGQSGATASADGMGGMHSGMHQNEYQHQDGPMQNGCPTDHDYNYSWDHNCGGC